MTAAIDRLPSVQLPDGKKAYFASDFHLGVAGGDKEEQVVAWLEYIRKDAHVVYLLGDLFDFWYEYKKVIPRGYVRFIGKLAQLADDGIQLIFFKGNHDMWMFDYFPRELGVTIYDKPISVKIGDIEIHMGHGDGLGPGEAGYKLLKKVFRNPLCIWLFGILPPRIGMGIAHHWSKSSRLANVEKGEEFKGPEHEYLLTYCQEVQKKSKHDFYIFGHRHLVLDLPVESESRYLNLGEWVHGSTYAVCDGKETKLVQFAP